MQKANIIVVGSIALIIYHQTLFVNRYSAFVTFDNKHITIPNGDLMNNNVTNYSCEENRRLDYEFKVTNDIDANVVRDTLLSAMAASTTPKNESLSELLKRTKQYCLSTGLP